MPARRAQQLGTFVLSLKLDALSMACIMFFRFFCVISVPSQFVGATLAVALAVTPEGRRKAMPLPRIIEKTLRFRQKFASLPKS